MQSKDTQILAIHLGSRKSRFLPMRLAAQRPRSFTVASKYCIDALGVRSYDGRKNAKSNADMQSLKKCEV
jgi:hypothetical protein